MKLRNLLFWILAGAGLCVPGAVGQVVDRRFPLVEGEVLVKFKRSAGTGAAARAAQSHGATVSRNFAALSARRGQSYALLRSSARTTEDLVTLLSRDPNVETVVPNYVKTVCGPVYPSDGSFGLLWGLHNTGQTVDGTVGTADADIDYPEALGLSRPGGAGVIVGIIDTGVDYSHPDLAGNLWVHPGETPANGIDDDGNGFVDDVNGYDFAGDAGQAPDADPMDVDIAPGHGTHVSGTVAAIRGNGPGVTGVSPTTRILALKASPDGTSIPDSASLAAIDYAVMMKTRGFPIVALNASYGGGAFNPLERDAIQAAGDAGIVFCAAAGNENLNNDTTPTYPANYRLANMVVVAASDAKDARASFSNTGATTVDLAAPGVNILSTVPVHNNTEAFAQAGVTTPAGLGLTYAGVTAGITGTLYACGLGYPGDFPAEVAGQIALIARGTLDFVTKTSNAMAAGAVAVILYNHTGNTALFSGTLQYPRHWIPAISVSKASGLALLALTGGPVRVVNRMNPATAWQFLSGTSMATPHVTGAIALMALHYPDDSVTQRIARLLSNTDAVAAFQSNTRTGGRLNLAKPLDTDADTLPDWWEMDAVTNLTGMTSTTDTDADGARDVDEFSAGTDAVNPADFFQAQAAVESAGTDSRVIRWRSAPEKSYTLQRSDSLLSPFLPIATGIPATPPLNTYTDSTAGSLSPLFYRLLLE